ncbi:MAG: purine-nucleoside phosphorylase, partial [Blautia sp.]
MNPVYEKLQSCLASVREKTDFIPRVALILGSGLGDYAEEIEIREIIPYEEIQGFPVSTVPGHKGRFI